MQTITGWIGLALMVYIHIELFYISSRTNKVIKISANTEAMKVEASEISKRGFRARYLWVKSHREQLPAPAHDLATRVITINKSCWAAVVVLFIIYGLQFLNPSFGP